MSGTPSLKRAYNLGLKAVPNFEQLPAKVVEYYEQHLDEIPAALKRGFIILPQKAPEPPVLALIVLATIYLGAMTEKPTSKCFVGGIWNKNWRDGNIDRWLQKNQPATGPCTVSTVGMSQAWTFLEAVKKLPGIDPNENDLVKVGNRLIELGYTTTCTQVQKMTERTERGENTKLRVDGYANFYLVETGDPKNPVSVGYVYRGGVWFSDVRRLGNAYRWHAGNVLLVRNLEASKLGH